MLSDRELASIEQEARRFAGAYTGTSGSLAGHIIRLLADRREILTLGSRIMAIEEHWLADALVEGIRGIPGRDLAIDVGANRGDWSREFAKIFHRVVAYEPDHRASIEIPVRDNIELRSEAVGESPGVATFYLRPNPGQNSLLSEHPIGGDSQSPAPVIEAFESKIISLDSAFPDGADVVKMDIEGGEVAALRGCTGEAWRKTLFVVECHDTRQLVADELWRLGKRLTLIRHPSPNAHPEHCWIIGEPSA